MVEVSSESSSHVSSFYYFSSLLMIYYTTISVWGAFNPYPLSSNISKQAVQKFPLPPFSSLSSIGHFAGLFASFAFVNRFTTCGSAVVRQQNDYFNDIIGIGAVWGHAYWLFNKSDKRILWNNRAVAGAAIGSILYANTGYGPTV